MGFTEHYKIVIDTRDYESVFCAAELYYDFLARFQHPPLPELQPEPGKGVVDASKAIPVPGISPKDYHPFKLIAFSNVQFLDARIYGKRAPHTQHQPNHRGQYTGIRAKVLDERWNLVSKRPLFRHRSNGCLRLTAILAGYECWERADSKSAHCTVKVFNLSGDLYITRYLRLIAGISNLTDEKYYDRVFANGIEPAPRRSGYAGLSLSF